jgi:multidrug efflux pump subunit AcrA (membrane-fusion protein)
MEDAGAMLDENTRIGVVHADGETYPVEAPYGGEIGEWLVADGDEVNPGQLVVRLKPESNAW